MRFDDLNDNNYLLFAIKNYENPQAITKEDFEDDLKRIKYVKRLLKRYKNTGELRTHLILNHLIVLFNVFGDAAVIFLNRIPEHPRSDLDFINEDNYCLEQLQLI
jgi:hypothetical protein